MPTLSSTTQFSTPTFQFGFGDLVPLYGPNIYQSWNEDVYGTSSGETIYMNMGGKVFSGGGNDVIRGELSGAMTIDAGSGSDTVYGGPEGDVIKAGTGHDWVDAGRGDDRVDGGSGNDTILGGIGSDFLEGGIGTDTVNGGHGNDRVSGGEGDDTLMSGGSGEGQIFYAGTELKWMGANALLAGWYLQADYMVGGAGNDTQYLQGGNVVATSGSDFDVVSGHDIFFCENSAGRDQYFIATGSETDTIVLTAFGATTGYSSQVSGDLIYEKYDFGIDSVLIAHSANAVPIVLVF